MALPEQTPAMTARKDLLTHSPKKKAVERYKQVEKRAREIMIEKYKEENLDQLWQNPSTRGQVQQRVYELFKIGKEQAEREIPPVTSDALSRGLYSRARLLRGRTNIWRSTGKEKFEAALEKSAQVAEAGATDLRELIAFLEEARPSIAEFTGEEGKESFDDDDIRRTHLDNGGIISIKEIDLYGSLMRVFDAFVGKLQHSLDELEEELAEYEEDPLGDIIDAVESLGLTQVYDDSDDGFLWFQDTETSQLYFFSLEGQKLDVRTMYSGTTVRPEDNWKGNWPRGLEHVIGGNRAGVYIEPARVCRDYFGIWNSIRPYLKKHVDQGNDVPDCLPVEYVERNVG